MEKIKYSSLIVLAIVLLGTLWTVPNATAEMIHTDEGVIITHYPDKFDKVGKLIGIDNEGIVIDDIFIPFSKYTRFMLPQREYATVRNFKKGQKVGLLIGEDQKVKMICLIYNN